MAPEATNAPAANEPKTAEDPVTKIPVKKDDEKKAALKPSQVKILLAEGLKDVPKIAKEAVQESAAKFGETEATIVKMVDDHVLFHLPVAGIRRVYF